MKRLPLLLLAGLLVGPLPVSSWAANAEAAAIRFENTVAALQERYADEMIAHRRYGAYARHALAEGYPAIAHLFRTLAASEAVHATNFARLLRELGQEPVMPSVDVALNSTREHLRQAATVEADEIDQEYPAILARIEGEGHEEAIRFIDYAWKAEQQHRDLILKIKKGASWFFGMLVSRIEGSPGHYHVCQVCGSTLSERPQGQCPICGHPARDYREISPFAEPSTTEPAAPAAAGD